ncbi:hypothetical protein Tco_0628569 [Tanacetum coccineum]|uniref:Uncharacterized protein n=1 Tax=Tanacetum coccineum TaxID=301880 RepID=A0ABQ4WQR4_9ASTR
MAETMEQYMSKTRANYGSRVARPKIKDNDNFELKGTLDEMSSTLFNGDTGAIQEMAEYSQKWHSGTSRSRSTETSDGLAAIQAQLNNLGREITKVNKKVYAAQVGCEQCKGPITPKITHSNKNGKTSRKLTTRNLVDLFKEGDIEQQL